MRTARRIPPLGGRDTHAGIHRNRPDPAPPERLSASCVGAFVRQGCGSSGTVVDCELVYALFVR